MAYLLTPNDEIIRKMILELVNHLDYDLSKQLSSDTAEEPEFAEELMGECVSIVETYLRK